MGEVGFTVEEAEAFMVAGADFIVAVGFTPGVWAFAAGVTTPTVVCATAIEAG